MAIKYETKFVGLFSGFCVYGVGRGDIEIAIESLLKDLNNKDGFYRNKVIEDLNFFVFNGKQSAKKNNVAGKRKRVTFNRDSCLKYIRRKKSIVEFLNTFLQKEDLSSLLEGDLRREFDVILEDHKQDIADRESFLKKIERGGVEEVESSGLESKPFVKKRKVDYFGDFIISTFVRADDFPAISRDEILFKLDRDPKSFDEILLDTKLTLEAIYNSITREGYDKSLNEEKAVFLRKLQGALMPYDNGLLDSKFSDVIEFLEDKEIGNVVEGAEVSEFLTQTNQNEL